MMANEEVALLLRQIQDAKLGAPWRTDTDRLLHGKRVFVSSWSNLH